MVKARLPIVLPQKEFQKNQVFCKEEPPIPINLSTNTSCKPKVNGSAAVVPKHSRWKTAVYEYIQKECLTVFDRPLPFVEVTLG